MHPRSTGLGLDRRTAMETLARWYGYSPIAAIPPIRTPRIYRQSMACSTRQAPCQSFTSPPRQQRFYATAAPRKKRSEYRYADGDKYRYPAWLLLSLGSVVLVTWIGVPFRTLHAEALLDEDHDHSLQPQTGNVQSRNFRLSEVEAHGPDSESPWVIRGQSVYDITDFVAAHPGGEVIRRAAGGSVDPYWKIFTIHQKQDVYDILEQYRIGSVDERDLVDGRVPSQRIIDPFLQDPHRGPELQILTSKPCNAETTGKELSAFITPNGAFYVRNHMWVPTLPEQQYNLTVELPDGEEKVYSLQDLKDNFKSHTITSTLQCSGNRRKHMTKACGSTSGLQWNVGAIGNATWTGVLLRDVLSDAGFPIFNPPPDAQHAQFAGLEAYGASIPLSKALDASGDVLLAYEMNGNTLPRDHGFPIRVIVPGHVAARSVKWVKRITISDEESTSQWQRRDYKCFGPNEGATPDWEHARSIQEMPITSAITNISYPSTSPSSAPDQDLPQEQVTVSGYAYSGGGREVIRVDISMDDGATWDQACLLPHSPESCSPSQFNKSWAWKRWQYSIPNARWRDKGREVMLVVKATDEAYNTQPERFEPIYNVRGNLPGAWHRMKVAPPAAVGSS